MRAIKWYRKRTSDENVRAGRRLLFVPYKKDNSSREISTPTISRWLTSVIRRAYEAADSDSDLSALANIRAHEVRALSTSWADFNLVPTEQIMSAAYWRSNSVFSSFYLRDMASHQDGIYALGPIVAAQQVVEPRL